MNEIYSENANVQQQQWKNFENPIWKDHIVDDGKPIWYFITHYIYYFSLMDIK